MGGVGRPIPLTYSHIIHATQSMHNTPTPPLVGPVVAVLIPHSTPDTIQGRLGKVGPLDLVSVWR